MNSVYGGLYEWSHWCWPRAGNHLWQATIFFFLVQLALRFLKNAPARARYAIWLVAGLKFIVPSALLVLLAAQLGFHFPVFRSSSGPALEGGPLISQFAEPVFQAVQAPFGDSAEAATTGSAGHRELYCVLTLVWAVGCIIPLALSWNRRRRFGRGLTAGMVATSGREWEALQRVQLRFERVLIKRLILSDAITEPGVWRNWSPILILPAGLASHLTEAELDAVLAHELVHVFRRDNLVSSLQMLLCCALWFHPLVWLIDHKLLAERERAVDEQVIQMGMTARVYAASLLKVVRFCSGWKVAGVSSATGSDLQKRIELIIANRSRKQPALYYRSIIGVTAAAVVLFSIAAGEFAHNTVHLAFGRANLVMASVGEAIAGPLARSQDLGTSSSEGFGEEQAQTPSGPVRTPLAEGNPSPGALAEFLKRAEQAPYTAARFANNEGAPITITAAQAKIISFKANELSSGNDLAGAYDLITMPQVTIVNNTNRQISSLRMRFNVLPQSDDNAVYHVDIEANGRYVFHAGAGQWSVIGPEGCARYFVISIIGARYEDGESWGEMEPPRTSLAPVVAQGVVQPTAKSPAVEPLAPALAGAPRQPFPEGGPGQAPSVAGDNLTPAPRQLAPASKGDSAPPVVREYSPAKYYNPEGVPLVIMQAKTGIVSRGTGNPDRMKLPDVVLSNNSNRRVTAVKLRFKFGTPEHAVTAKSVAIEPGSFWVFHSDMVVSGYANQMRVQVVGVGFDDGSVWGSLNSTIDSRDEWVKVP